MNPYRIFLTGDPGSGKTTVVRRVHEALEKRGSNPGGMISSEIRQGNARVGFGLEDLMTHESGVLAHVDQTDGPRVGKYRVNLVDIERIGVTAIGRALTDSSLIIVDEIGPMELSSIQFVRAVETALESQRNFIGTIHKRASHHLVTAIKSNPTYEIVEVTQENRDRLPAAIIERLDRQA